MCLAHRSRTVSSFTKCGNYLHCMHGIPNQAHADLQGGEAFPAQKPRRGRPCTVPRAARKGCLFVPCKGLLIQMIALEKSDKTRDHAPTHNITSQSSQTHQISPHNFAPCTRMHKHLSKMMTCQCYFQRNKCIQETAGVCSSPARTLTQYRYLLRNIQAKQRSRG